jgi:hypothetical protein
MDDYLCTRRATRIKEQFGVNEQLALAESRSINNIGYTTTGQVTAPMLSQGAFPSNEYAVGSTYENRYNPSRLPYATNYGEYSTSYFKQVANGPPHPNTRHIPQALPQASLLPSPEEAAKQWPKSKKKRQ